MDVLVTGFACSPRRGGNTETMLDSALSGAASAGARVRKVAVCELNINPCLACNACFKKGSCAQSDDMQEIYPLLLESAGVIIAAPIFSMNLAAQAKILIDRLQCFWAIKYVLKKSVIEDRDFRSKRRGLWLATAGMKKDGIFDPAYVTVKYFYAMLEIGEHRKLTYSGVDEKGAIRLVPGALEACFREGGWIATGVDGHNCARPAR